MPRRIGGETGQVEDRHRLAVGRLAAEEIVRQKALRRVSAAFDTFLEGRLARLNRRWPVAAIIWHILVGN